MTNREELLFTDLTALTEDQIAAGLAAGVWREPTKPFVEHYLEQLKVSRTQAEVSAQGLEAIRSVVSDGRSADVKATMALIIAVGAMLAAMAAGLVAFLALRGVTISW
jgi:hypothetical protein